MAAYHLGTESKGSLMWAVLLLIVSARGALAEDAKEITEALKDRAQKQIVVHNDFGNLLHQAAGAEPAAAMAAAARRESTSKADIISLCAVSTEGMCFYWPTRVGQNPRAGTLFQQMQPLTAAGVDPFGLVVEQVRAGGCTVLGKLRTNDCHHVTGLPERASFCWASSRL